jgi:hypothetical protein
LVARREVPVTQFLTFGGRAAFRLLMKLSLEAIVGIKSKEMEVHAKV